MKEGFDSPRDRHLMSYYVYILSSRTKGKLITYTGYTKNVSKRLMLHNLGKGAKFTRGRFWKLIFKKKFINKNNALKFEYKVKNNRSLKMKLINE